MYVFMVENTPKPSRPGKERMARTATRSAQRLWRCHRVGARPGQRPRQDRPAIVACFAASAPWHSGRVLLIGDAAHAPTPHLAMGAGIAMEDAVVLGEMLDPSVELA